MKKGGSAPLPRYMGKRFHCITEASAEAAFCASHRAEESQDVLVPGREPSYSAKSAAIIYLPKAGNHGLPEALRLLFEGKLPHLMISHDTQMPVSGA